jgi:hypothetical protein
LAQFGLQKCLFRYGENAMFKKKVVFTSTVPGPPGCLSTTNQNEIYPSAIKYGWLVPKRHGH